MRSDDESDFWVSFRPPSSLSSLSPHRGEGGLGSASLPPGRRSNIAAYGIITRNHAERSGIIIRGFIISICHHSPPSRGRGEVRGSASLPPGRPSSTAAWSSTSSSTSPSGSSTGPCATTSARTPPPSPPSVGTPSLRNTAIAGSLCREVRAWEDVCGWQ